MVVSTVISHLKGQRFPPKGQRHAEKTCHADPVREYKTKRCVNTINSWYTTTYVCFQMLTTGLYCMDALVSIVTAHSQDLLVLPSDLNQFNPGYDSVVKLGTTRRRPEHPWQLLIQANCTRFNNLHPRPLAVHFLSAHCDVNTHSQERWLACRV